MQERLNAKHQTFYEILKSANESDDPIAYLKQAMTKDSRLTPILGYALNPGFKMPLPPGIPPYIPSQHPIGVAPVEILNTHNKLYIMYNKETRQFKKEEIFVQWLEDMAPEEADLMIKIKDQELPGAMPNLTLDVFLSALGWSAETYQSLLERNRAKP